MRHEFLLPGTNGYDLSCLEWTCEKANAVLICLHGFTGDKYSPVVEAVAQTVSKAGVRVIGFDWPGHGKSPADSRFLTVENCLRDLDVIVQYVREPGLPLFLFANSFGCFLGLNYVRHAPETFSRIILRSPALNMPDTCRTLLPEEEWRRLERGEQITVESDRPLTIDIHFYEDLCRHRIADVPAPAAVPGMLIQGDLDDVVSPQDSYDYAQRNGWKLCVVRGADHLYQKPGEVEQIVGAVSAFLPGVVS